MKKQLKIIGLGTLLFSLLFACDIDDPVITTPSDVSNLTAEAGEKQVTLTWTKPTDSDIKEYWITLDPLVIDAFSIDKNLETYTIDNLENGVEYTITIMVKNMSGGVSNGVSVTAEPTAVDRPAEVTNLSSLSSSGQITLSWTRPSDEDLAGYELSYQPGDANISLDNDVESYVIEGLDNGTEYTFVLKTKDLADNTSLGTTIKATPTEGDNVPPAEVSEVTFSGDYEEQQFTAVWANPIDTDFQEVELTYFYDPENPTTVIITGPENSITIDGSYEQNYTLVFKTKDASGNFSTGVTKKIRFGNFQPGSAEDMNALDPEITHLLAGKLAIWDVSGVEDSHMGVFSNLEVLEGKFQLKGTNITHLDAFAKLMTVEGKIDMLDNTNLTDFCGLKSLFTAGASGDFTATGNGSDPAKQEIIDNCN